LSGEYRAEERRHDEEEEIFAISGEQKSRIRRWEKKGSKEFHFLFLKINDLSLLLYLSHCFSFIHMSVGYASKGRSQFTL